MDLLYFNGPKILTNINQNKVWKGLIVNKNNYFITCVKNCIGACLQILHVMGFLFYIPSVKKWSWRKTLGCDEFVALTYHRTSWIMVVFSCYLVLTMSDLSSSTTLCLIIYFLVILKTFMFLPIRICLTMTIIVIARPCCYSLVTKNYLEIFITLSKIQKNWWDFHE